MNGFLIDTDVISELRKRERCHKGVKQWIQNVEQEQLFLSVLVTGELRRGIALIRRRDSKTAQHLDIWLKKLKGKYQERILPVTTEIAEIWGGLGLERPVPPIDGLLAATALYHDLTLVTRNVKDIAQTPAKILNPFKKN